MNLKLKRTPGLYLVGFMGSGKSTAGRLLASNLGWQFADIDQGIEQEHGVTIREIFETRGEAAFREIEAEAIRKRVEAIRFGHPWVLALGGGAFVQERNWELMHNNGVTLWLDCSLERIQQRLNGDTSRPLASNRERLSELYGARQHLYARADFRVDADCDDPAEVVHQILRLPLF